MLEVVVDAGDRRLTADQDSVNGRCLHEKD